MSKDVDLHIGGSFDDAAGRFARAWHRAEQGEHLSEEHLTFVDWEAFSQTMTAKRLELLRHLHRNPAASTASLARSLGRNYRRVHDDVEILTKAGLIDQDETGLRVGYDEIRSVIAL
jgi:predicted transcriptional regulator